MGLMLAYEMLNQTLTESNEAPLRAQISGVMGSTSLACWIVLLTPQLIEQWRLKSAEGIAIGFISIWFMGDAFNLIGSIWAGLLPEVVFLAIWFCIADFMMIFSYVYYSFIYPKHHHRQHKTHHHHHHDEEEPLIERRRRSSTLTDIALEPEFHSVFTKYALPLLFVVGAGVLGYFISGTKAAGDNSDQGGSSTPVQLGPQIVGYFSAFLYLGARIPQIIQNYRRKSVHGLSLLFFLLSTLGNLTYAGQIIFYRSDPEYIVLNLSWLLGSLGTIFEDSFIFFQFYLYRENNKDDVEAIE